MKKQQVDNKTFRNSECISYRKHYSLKGANYLKRRVQSFKQQIHPTTPAPNQTVKTNRGSRNKFGKSKISYSAFSILQSQKLIHTSLIDYVSISRGMLITFLLGALRMTWWLPSALIVLESTIINQLWKEKTATSEKKIRALKGKCEECGKEGHLRKG